MKSFRLNIEWFNSLRNVKYLLKITFVLMFLNITWFNYFKSPLWVSPPVLGGPSLGVVCLGPDVTILSFDSAVHGRLNARCSELFILFNFPSV